MPTNLFGGQTQNFGISSQTFSAIAQNQKNKAVSDESTNGFVFIPRASRL
jgi:hypothetical protein